MEVIAKITKWCLDHLDRNVSSPFEGHRRSKGVALLLVLVTITLIAATVVEFAYETRIDLALSANTRDKVKSEYLARSAVNIARLLLSFQFALQNESDETESSMGQQINLAIRRSNFQMYQYIDLLMGPFNSGKIETPVGGVNLSESGVEGFGDFTGDMTAKVIPEDGRLNLNQFAKNEISQTDLTALCSLFLNSSYSDLFERKDPLTGETLDRGTMLARIIDHIDLNKTVTKLTEDCRVESQGGDEERLYRKYQDEDKLKIRPKNARLSHVAELRQVPGVDDAFFEAFKEDFTVYHVGKPNINVANAAVFFSVLCQHVQLSGTNVTPEAKSGLSLCSTNPEVALQVFWFSMALDGVRTFFENPMTVLLGYVGSAESRLLPSAKKGQPVAFVMPSQLPSYISDLKSDPQLMAKFLMHSSLFSELAFTDPQFSFDPLAPSFPQWSIGFDSSGLINAVSTDTPKIYRIRGTGRYGSTETTLEVVLDFGKTLRRLPSFKEIKKDEMDVETTTKLLSKRSQLEQKMPKGRYLYWHQE